MEKTFQGLLSDLYIPLRDTLCRCQEFQSYRTLRDVFVVEPLFPFRIGLPFAESPEDLVDHCLGHLIEKRLRNGQPVLPFFLATLRDRYHPGDALRDDLDNLYNLVHEAMSPAASQVKPSPRRRQLLFDRLLQLDFRPQVRLVKEVIEEHRVAAFLIHGPPYYGQRMLAYRLARLEPQWVTGQHVIVDAGSNGTGLRCRSLWGQLAKKLRVSPQTAREELANKVGEWWKTQDVIFTFHTVDYMPASILSTWIEDFWEPLVSMARRIEHQTDRRTYLLLFLVDYAGKVCRSGLSFGQCSQDIHGTHWPILLPEVEPFPEIELEIWVDAAAEVVPTGLAAEAMINEPYAGVPELVYEQICEHCGFSWQGEIAP